MQTQEDKTLIDRFKESGDKEAFESLITKYENHVYRFGFRMCGQVQDAEDVVQDTFVSAFRYLKDFRGEASLLSWLLKIASSVCLKKRRLRKNEPRTYVPYDELQVQPSGEVQTRGKDGGSPDALVLSAEVRKIFHEALTRIPPLYREVLALREMEGLSGKETAEALDISESAVKVRLHRARAMVYREFEALYHGKEEHDVH